MSISTPLRAPKGWNGSTVHGAIIELGVLVDYISAAFQMTASTLSPARQRAQALWRRHPREIGALGLLALAGAVAAGGVAWSTPSFDEIAAARNGQTAPEPPPLLVRNIAPQQALAVNSEIPLASGPNPAAAPFSLGKVDSATRARALECLTSAVYYEAGNQSADGERAVAQVVLNRVRHPAFPSSVCGVVYQGSTQSTGCQFTFTCDGSLERRPDAQGWARAKQIAEAALNGAVFGPVGLATHYHADYVVPYWASTMAKNAVVGAHLFYRWPGSWGRAAAFSQHYAKIEPNVGALKAAALAALASRPAAAETQQVADIPGAEVEKAPPGRVAVRFNLATLAAARKAANEAPHEDYVEKVDATENLRWTLTGSAPDAPQTPLGRPAKPYGPTNATNATND
jgi:spore germination cell wall hydrolase CwlJ-like protein